MAFTEILFVCRLASWQAGRLEIDPKIKMTKTVNFIVLEEIVEWITNKKMFRAENCLIINFG